jgi:hypothetical protein
MLSFKLPGHQEKLIKAGLLGKDQSEVEPQAFDQLAVRLRKKDIALDMVKDEFDNRCNNFFQLDDYTTMVKEIAQSITDKDTYQRVCKLRDEMPAIIRKVVDQFEPIREFFAELEEQGFVPSDRNHEQMTKTRQLMQNAIAQVQAKQNLVEAITGEIQKHIRAYEKSN